MKKIIVANWKMNPPTASQARRLFGTVKRAARNLRNTEVVLAPPFLYLPILKAGKIKLAAQDVFWGSAGHFTGEVSVKMLRSAGVSQVIVGHSERRELGDTDEIIHRKLAAAFSGGLRVILCVGEKEKSRESFPAIVREEVRKALKGISRRFAPRLIIAYEPVWALSYRSGGRADTPQNFFEMSIFIRRLILDLWGKSAAFRIPILYGGSVHSKNAESFLEVEGTSGLLVGKASLDEAEFTKILEAANEKR